MIETRFIDKFSGIGGFRRGLELSGGYRCVWSNDINRYANQVYTARFGEEGHHSGDIRRVDPSDIPDHDLLCAGFPCQAFSVAGKRHGFKDTRGTLFFEVCRVAEAKRPRLLLLENVKGLLSHDGGRTFATILQSLEELGYWWEYQVLNSKHFGVPQNRERVFIIGHIRGGGSRPVFPISEASEVSDGGDSAEQVANALQSPGHAAGNYRGMNMIVDPTILRWQNKEEGVVMDDKVPTLRSSGGTDIRKKPVVIEPFIQNLPHGYNDGFKKPLPSLGSDSGAQYNELLVLENGPQSQRIYDPKGISPSLSGVNRKNSEGQSLSPRIIANAVTDGWLMDTSHHSKPMCEYRIRRLTPVECERLQGFPDGWTEGISDTQRYKCLGNAVTVPVIKFLGDRIKECLA